MNVESLSEVRLPDAEEDTQRDKYLAFKIGDEEYAIGISHVMEIIGLMKITEVPDMPQFIKGVINLRGRVIPLMDVRLRFNKPERDYDERTCIIILRMEETMIGLVVDRIAEVEDILPENIDSPPRFGDGEQHHYIKGLGKVGEEVKIILDPSRLLFSEEWSELKEIQKE